MSEVFPSYGILNVGFLKKLLLRQLNCSAQKLNFKLVYHLSLEYRNLVKISCIWPLTNLTKLNLSGNSITKIENLELLVNLEELNISFNKISKIENLETLTKLRKLCLYANRIEILEGLHNLKKLNLLNVGKNLIEDQTCPFYLEQFKSLRCLVLEENLCYEGSNDIDDYLLALMPQLLDLNYCRITETKRYSAVTAYKMKTKGLNKFAILKIENLKKTMKHQTVCQTFENEHFQTLFTHHKLLLELSNELEIFHTINKNFRDRIGNLFRQVEEALNGFKNAMKVFQDCYNHLKVDNTARKRSYMNDIFSNIKSRSIGKTVRGSMDENFRMQLLFIECGAQHEFEELIKKFQHELCSESIKLNALMKTLTDRMRDEISLYSTSIFRNIANQYLRNVKNKISSGNLADINAQFCRFYDLDEYERHFLEYCGKFVENLEKGVTSSLIETIKLKADSMIHQNLLRHRKSVFKIIEAAELLKQYS